MLLERPRRYTVKERHLTSWKDFKAEMLREDLERWGEDERIAEKEG
jgi:hypothetical protein